MEIAVSIHKEEYPVTIDYGRDIDEMIADGNYESVNLIYFDARAEDANVVGMGVVESCLRLADLEGCRSLEEARYILQKNNLRTASFRELLAFGATYPDVQLRQLVLTLCSTMENSIPCLSKVCVSRALEVLYFGDGLGSTKCFLVVGK